jgi:hypothetical protein
VEFIHGSGDVDGRTAVKVGADAMDTPGLLCNYRLRYLSGRGETITERIEQIYVTPDGEVTTGDIELTGGIPAAKAESYEGVDAVASMADELIQRAEDRAWEEVNEVAEEARVEREREVRIKREHAERYFDSRIEDLEEDLERYQERDRREDVDMSAQINRTRSELNDVRTDYEAELERLEEDEQVVPDEPELINTAVVVGL